MSAADLRDGEFSEVAEPFRRELLAHCYRMLGSVHEAEDVVQEAYLRAWRSYDRFEGRSSVRTWLYRIATNACLTSLGHATRRVLPSGLAAPSDDPLAPTAEPGPGTSWLEPFPGAVDPAVVAASHENLRLALVASLQYLAARQRAVLLLRDVLAFPAVEVAAMLGITVPAVKSLLQRARARLQQVEPKEDELTEPTDPDARALLDQYLTAFQTADVELLEKALRTDAALEVVGSSTWFSGLVTCLEFLRGGQVMGMPGEWRMVATEANGQPAAAAYWRGEPYGLAVLTVTPDGISRITVFPDPSLIRFSGNVPVSRRMPAAAGAEGASGGPARSCRS